MIRVAISPLFAAMILLKGRSSNSPPGASGVREVAAEKSLSSARGSADLKRRAPPPEDRVVEEEKTEAEEVMVRRTARLRALLLLAPQLPRPADRRRARVAAERIMLPLEWRVCINN